MAVYALTSLSGAPGVSTTAVAWAYQAARPTLLVEADVTGGSPILTTVWAGSMAHEQSILHLASVAGDDLLKHLWDQALTLPGTTDRWVIPTIGHPAQARSLTPVWAPLARALHRLSEDGGVDVLIDAGRLGTPGGPWTLIESADLALVFTDTTLAALNVTRIGVETLRPELELTGPAQRLAVVPVVGDTKHGAHLRPYTAADVAGVMDPVAVVGQVVRDERRAASPADQRGDYARSIQLLIGAAERHLAATRALSGLTQEIR